MDTLVTVALPEEEMLTAETPAPEPNPLAAENARLADENRRLRAEAKRREIAALLAELRASGQLTPAMEYAGIEEALVSAEEQGLMVQLPDGKRLSFSAVLRDVLSALPCSYVSGCVCGESATAGSQLSADELAIASSLGLSAQEYAEIRSA